MAFVCIHTPTLSIGAVKLAIPARTLYCHCYSIVIIILVNAFTLLAANTVANFLLLTFAFVLTDITLFPSALPLILSFIRPSPLLSPILAIIGISKCY